MENVLVSIVMPAWNAAPFIRDAVASVLAQSYPHWELLIVNDASTDDTLAIARELATAEPRIQVFDQPRNGGVAAARNRALDAARGRYIAFLDSDDLWVPDKLERQIAFMEREGVLVSYGGYRRISEAGETLGEVRPPARISYRDLLKSNFIGNLTGVYDAQALGKERFSDFRHEDYVAWLALVRRAGSARAVPGVLGHYRVLANSTSANKLRALLWQWRIYRQNQALGFFESCRLMFWYGNHALAKRLS